MLHSRFALALCASLATLPFYPHSDVGATTRGAPLAAAAATTQHTPLLVAENKLPGGVSSRLRKIDKELDRAEKALAKGAGSVQDRARRAALYLKKANGYRNEIDKRYGGQFSPEDSRVSAVYGRIAQVEQQITAAEQSAPEPARTAPPAKPTARDHGRSVRKAPTTDPATGLPQDAALYLKKLTPLLDRAEQALQAGDLRQAEGHLGQARRMAERIQGKYPPEVLSASADMQATLDRYTQLDKSLTDTANASEEAVRRWTEKLRPYVQGDSALLIYATDEAAQWTKWQNSYAQVKPLWDEYQAAQLVEKSGELSGMEMQLERQLQRYEELYPQWEKKNAAAARLRGEVLFSSARIDPANPQGTQTRFKAGDYIYGHIKAKKSWREIFGNQVNVRIDTRVDGKPVHAQFIELKSAALQNGKELPLEIAPAPDRITAYSNPDLEYGTSKAGLRQGPQQLTEFLSQLAPGRHRMDFSVQYYGKVYAQGGFEIEADDFGFYADLNKKAAAAAASAVTLPPARMDNPGMADKMRKLLESAGWSDIHRLNIVDRDWWLDRVSGGNSPVSSRHMDAAVLAKDGKGYYYKKVRFQEDRLITGGFGELYILHTGDRYDVPEANIDK